MGLLVLFAHGGQLGRGRTELIPQHRRPIQFDLAPLALLGEEFLQFLIVSIQSAGPILQLLILPRQGRLFLLEVLHVALEHHRTVGAAGQNDQL